MARMNRRTAPTPQITLKSKYLSFIIKNYLTNGIGRYIHCAMNANEVSPKAKLRMNRIRIVSRIAKFVMISILIFTLYKTFILGVLWTGRISLSFILPNHPFNLHTVIGTIFQAVLWVWYWKLFRLFSLYEQGLIFSAQTIRCIKILGVLCVVGWAAVTLLQILPHPLPSSQITQTHSPEVVVGMVSHYRMGFFSFDFGTGINFGLLFAGIIIVLIAWIMDEGRKIQEEQELTV